MDGQDFYEHELQLVRFLADRLERRLAGREEDRIVNRLPVDHCRLGVLLPSERGTEEPEFAEGEPVEEPDDSPSGEPVRTAVGPGGTASGPDEAAAGEETGSAEAREERLPLRRPPSALGMELRIRPEGGEILLEVEVEFAVYTRHLPTFEEQRRSLGGEARPEGAAGSMTLAEVCQRWTVRPGPVRFRVPLARPFRANDGGAVQRAIEGILDQACGRPDAMRALMRVPEVPEQALASEESFQQWLAKEVLYRPLVRPPLRAALTVHARPRANGDVQIQVYLENRTPSNRNKRSEDYYHILADVQMTVRLLRGEASPVEILPVPKDYMYDRRVWAVGHNASVEADADRRTFRTQTLARYEQPRLALRSSEDARFDVLSQDPLGALGRIWNDMEAFAQEWERKLDTNELGLDAESLKACRKDLESFREEIDQFACGIAAMVADQRLLDAFKAMNRVMGRVAGSRFDRWRLFQVVFIVSQLPALAAREGRRRGEWPPGRPRRWEDHLEIGEVLWIPTGGGKTEAYLGLVCCAILYDRLRGKKGGVTAWLRLPLRMLSIQQLQRALRMIWEAEQERRALLGSQADLSDPIRLGYFVGSGATPNILYPEDLDRLDAQGLERLRLAPNCVGCGGRGTVRVHLDRRNVRILHRCEACGAELPLLISDSEIYRFLPALVIGTVDKIAAIGMQQRFGILIRGPEWRCAHGYGRGERCGFGCRGRERSPVSIRDPAPSLYIQDELHLLQEELGAFAGHYETLLRYLAEDGSGQPPKVIAATATIEGFEHQMRHLYGVRRARRFPARGYERYRNFYMEPETAGDGVKRHRIFLGFRPTGGHPTDAASGCAEILLEAVAEMIENPYQGLAVLQGLRDEKALYSLLELYNMALIYVGTLPGGTRARENLAHGYRIRFGREINVEYLSSRSTPAEITRVIEAADHPPPWTDKEHLDAVVATNMISHGVDFERANLMILDHFPGDVSEYIQATSRCGRRHLGLVISILPAYSIRASSIYNRFREFHDHLDRMVQPVPVNRFARRAVERTLPGILCGLIMAREGLSRLDQIQHAILNNSQEKQRLIERIRRAYGLGRGVYEDDLERLMDDLLKNAWFEQEMVLRNSRMKNIWEAMRPAPMRSLRDIEPGVPFRPSPEADERVLRMREQR